jgi:hypothetical protein
MSISVETTPALAARWVQWAAAASPRRNPISDPDGRHAHRNQPGDVFFLAGTYGEDAVRSCTVPAGRPLFFPAFNIWHVGGAPIAPMPDAYGRAFVDHVSHPVVTADSGPAPFEVRGAWRNDVTGTRSSIPMRVWGIWATVPPLAPGPHQVHFEGGTGDGFRVTAHYELTVA